MALVTAALAAGMRLFKKRKHRTLVFICGWTAFCGFFVLLDSAGAQEDRPNEASAEIAEGPVAVVPSGVPALPGPRENKSQFQLSKDNAFSFQDLLLEPISSLLENQKLSARVIRNLDFAWRQSRSWEHATRKNSNVFSLAEDMSLQRQGGIDGFGLPFGRADEISAESDPVKQAYKILWNVAYRESSAKDILYQGELLWFQDQVEERRSKVYFYRQMHFEVDPTSTVPATNLKGPPAQAGGVEAAIQEPGAAVPAPSFVSSPSLAAGVKTAAHPGLPTEERKLLREEVLHMIAPPVVFGYAQIGKRYRGSATDDSLWIHSPVLGRTREVLSSNRSDRIIDGELTLDDFFVFSEKVERVNARVVGEKVILVPFPAFTYYLAEEEKLSKANLFPLRDATALPNEGTDKDAENVVSVWGYHQRTDGIRTMVLWNDPPSNAHGEAVWVPRTMVFVPRSVWIIEVLPKDPYYGSGKQIVVVDQESMLPVYKLIYSRSGEFERTVMAGWSLARTKEGDLSFPFVGFLLGINKDGSAATGFATHYARTFLGKNSKLAGVVRELLSLEHYKAKESPRESPKDNAKEPAKTAAPSNEQVGSEKPQEKSSTPENKTPSEGIEGRPEEPELLPED